MKRNFNPTLLDRYIINRLIPILVFSLFICTVVCELVGISFEQVKFVATEGLPVDISLQIHLLKLPVFICQALPLALLLATITLYGQLSTKNEVIALQSCGISPYRLLAPTMAIAIVLSISMFALNELVVPAANYQAAMVLESEWQVDRTQLAKYNKREIIYQKYSAEEKTGLEFLFFAERFDGNQMLGITLLKYQDRYLREIITSQTAQWNEGDRAWLLSNGHQDVLNIDGSFAQNQDFKRLSVKLDKDILDYANHHRDLREMNLSELYHRLGVIEHTNNGREIHQIKISIQERYAFPFSCLVFALLGSVLGINTGVTDKSNDLGIAAIVVIIYYLVQFLTTVLTAVQIMSITLGVWFPNLLCLSLGCYMHQKPLTRLQR